MRLIARNFPISSSLGTTSSLTPHPLPFPLVKINLFNLQRTPARMKLYVSFAILTLWLQAVNAQDVSCSLTPSYAAPVMAEGWESRLILTGLSRPRSILLDSTGGLLVVQQRAGITHLRLADGNGTCLSVAKRTELVRDAQVSLDAPLLPQALTFVSAKSRLSSL